MRRVALSLLLLLLVPTPALAEDEYLVDEWTAIFIGGAKRGWRHREITRSTDEGSGAVRIVHIHRRWIPDGEEMLHRRTKTTTDGTGRVLRFEESHTGPLGPITVRFDGTAYKATIRKLTPLDGTVDEKVFDLDVLAALIRAGTLKPGERSVKRLDLPEGRAKEVTFSTTRTEQGLWRYAEDDLVELRTAEGVFLSAHESDKPHGSERPATEANAPDLAVRDKEVQRSSGPLQVSAQGVALTAPGDLWQPHRSEMRPGMMTLGMEHPLQVGVLVMLTPAPLERSVEKHVEMAQSFRAAMLRDADRDMQLTEPKAGTWRKRPAAVMAVSGTMSGEPLEGSAYLVRSDTGQAVFVLAMYAKDLKARLAPLAEKAMAGIQLSRPTVWKRVQAKAAALSLEVPKAWQKSPFAEQWGTRAGPSVIAVNAGAMPDGIALTRAQDYWVTSLKGNPNISDLKVLETAVVEIDGRTMHKKVLQAVMKRGKVLMPMTAISVARTTKAPAYVEVVILLVAGSSKPAYAKRVLESIRWTGPK